MKSKFISIFLIILILTSVIIPMMSGVVQASTSLTNDELLKVNGKTITKTTTIEQINAMFGTPVLETESAFGGKMYSYTDSDYSYYLCFETDESGIIKSYGAIGGNFISKRYNQGDVWDGYYWYLSGCSIEEYRNNNVMGIMEYNCNSKDVNSYWKRYEQNSSEYLYGLQKHSVIISKLISKKYGTEFVTNYADEETFYTNEQLKYNDTDIYDYAVANGKTEYVQTAGYSSYEFYDCLPNPIKLGRRTLYYEQTANYQIIYDIQMKDYDKRAYIEKIIFVDPSFLNDDRKDVELTPEEKIKLANAQAEYDNYINCLAEIGDNVYEQKPNYESLPLDAGKYKDATLEAVTHYLNVARAGIGIGTLALNNEIADCAQHKATLIAYMSTQGMELGHFPEQPDGVSDEFYHKSQSYMNENLYMGSIQSSIWYALNDGYGQPIKCGHRYNLLEPSYTQWGAGSVNNQGCHKFSGYNSYSNELVAWPSNGIMPLDFGGISVGNWTARFYKNYTVTDDTEATVKCLNTDKTYEITKADDASGEKILRIDKLSNLVTFRDDSITYGEGDVLEITLHNMKNSDGELVDYTYRTVFYMFGAAKRVSTEELVMDKSKVDLTIGSTDRVKVTAEPATSTQKLMKFTSADETIAIVRQDGTIKGIKEGTTTVTVTCGSISKEIIVNVSKVLKGDVNVDGKINTLDAIMVLQHISHKITLADTQKLAADASGDENINTLDVIKILQYISHKITQF